MASEKTAKEADSSREEVAPFCQLLVLGMEIWIERKKVSNKDLKKQLKLNEKFIIPDDQGRI